MAMTMAQASAAMREAMRETVKRYSTWYLLEGVFLVIAGVLALVYPYVASVALVFLIGWILIISGVLQGIGLIGAKEVPHFWLQLISSELGTLFIRSLQIPVYLEGNVIDLGVYKLQVVEACSGLRYLYPLMSLGFLAAYFFHAPFWQRAFVPCYALYCRSAGGRHLDSLCHTA
jgi:uncharacterized membrane protein HdeD (DUF308 family)